MSNPYIPPSIVGYNASPPPNDGTTTTANQLDWDFHKDKLADPIKTFAEGVDSAVLAAFGLLFGSAVLAKTANYTVGSGDRGRFITVTGASTITLIDVASAGSGFPLAIVNIGSDVVTVDGSGAETINGLTVLSLFPGDGVVLTSNGVTWAAIGHWAVEGTFTPTYSAGFSVDPSGDITYAKRQNIVTLKMPGDNGTSNASTFVINNLPATITPINNMLVPVAGMVDNGNDVFGQCQVASTGSLIFYPEDVNAGWTASGNKGFSGNAGTAPVFSYPLRYT